MLPEQPARRAASTVACKTQFGPGWAGLGFALGVHAALLGLLLQRHPSRPVTPLAWPIEVTLDMETPGAAPLPTLPEAIPADPVLPASDAEPKPALPPPAASVPSAGPLARLQPPAPPPIPMHRVTVKPVARRAPTLTAQAATAKPDATPSPANTASAAPSAPPAAPALQPAPSPGAVGAWRSDVSAWLREHRTYPEAARRDGVEGRVVVRFTLDSTGLVTSVALAGSSGSAVLDEAAQALLRGAHLPPPPQPASDHLSITLPISYTLAP